MNSAVLLLNLVLCFAGFGALALSLDRHHRDALGSRVPTGRVLPLRLAGWGLLLLSLAVAIGLEGVNFGPVQWIGALTGAGIAVVGLASYRPVWLRPAALSALPLGILLLPVVLAG